MYLDLLYLVAYLVGGSFGLLMSVWMWRTRPSKTVPAYRRSAPDHLGQYPSAAPRFAVDGRRRDLRPVSM